jgi:hypothetical protein
VVALTIVGGGFLQPVLVVVCGMVLTALAVQDESPLREDASWRARPIAPSAVWGSKVMIGLALLVSGLLGQAVALGRYAPGASDMIAMLLLSALSYSAWLMVGLLLATQTRSILAFIVSLLAIPVGIAAWSLFAYWKSPQVMLAEPSGSRASPLTLLVVVGIPLAGGLLVSVAVYARRIHGVTMRAMAGIAVALLVLSAITAVSTPVDAPQLASPSVADAPFGTVIELEPLRNGTRPLAVHYQMDHQYPEQRVSVDRATIALMFPDGKRYQLPMSSDGHERTLEAFDALVRREPRGVVISPLRTDPRTVPGTSIPWVDPSRIDPETRNSSCS